MRSGVMAGILIALGVLAARATAAAAGEVSDFEGIPFVWCPPGTYVEGMGVPPEEIEEKIRGGRAEWYGDAMPQHEVSIQRGFWLSKTEVTRAQWEQVMKTRPWEKAAKPEDLTLPVSQVSWEDAQLFLQRLGSAGSETFRLPTEAEWEYACRAGTETLYFFGEDHKQIDEHVWHWGNTTQAKEPWPHPTGVKKPNAWGLHDMLGNVWEWCQDNYARYPAEKQADPCVQDGGSLRVVRGGSFVEWAPLQVSSYRSGLPQGQKNATVGLRILREAD